MAMKAQIKASLGWNWDDGVRDSGRLEYARTLLDGNGDNQAEAVWHAESRTLAAGESDTFDLAALERTVLGAILTVNMAAVKALLIVNESTVGGQLLVGGAAVNQWSEPFGADGDCAMVPADSALLLCNRQSGWPVDANNRNLKIAALAGSATYSIAVVGTTTPAGSGSGSGV